MGNRIAGFAIVLDEKFMHDEDAERIKMAIEQIKGVVLVTEVVADLGHLMAISAAKSEIRKKILDIILER